MPLALQWPRPFYGWWVVFATSAILVITGATFFFGFTTLVNPLAAEFGWGRGIIGLAFSLRSELGGIVAPGVGLLVDRLGPRRIILAGVMVVGLGLLWFSRINSLATFYGATLVIALGMTACGPAVGAVAIARWFRRRRGRAMALMTAGVGVSGPLVLLLAWLIDLFGWRNAVTILASAALALGIPLALLVRDRPEELGLLVDGEAASAAPPSPAPAQGLTLREALTGPTFWLLTSALALSYLGGHAVIVHQMPALIWAGIPKPLAALTVTLFVVTSVLGRLGFGWLADFLDKRRVIATALLFQALGILAFSQVREAWQIAPFLLLFSLGFGGLAPLRPAIIAEYFGLRSLGAILGISFTIVSLGMVAGPALAGWMFDLTQSYHLAFFTLSLAALTAVPLALSLPPAKASP